MLKAIETVYKGYRFRSRLEARWAVFFDALGIEWEYEKEGYDLGGVWYLPDFWLPDQQCWIEVKGKDPTIEEMKKAQRLQQSTDMNNIVVFFQNIPAIQSSESRTTTKWPVFKTCNGDTVAWEECMFCGKFILFSRCVCDEKLRSAFPPCNHGDSALYQFIVNEQLNFIHTPGAHKTLIGAFEKARQARFEHGESPELLLRRFTVNYVTNRGGMCCRFCGEWCENGNGLPSSNDKHATNCPVLLIR